MSFELKELQDSTRRVIDAAGIAADESELWSQLTELGWLMVTVPESLGGLEAGVQGACTMHCELGRGLARAPYLPAMLALDAICGSEQSERDTWLEQVFAGGLITTCLAECSLHVSDSRLDGSATGVQSADSAQHVLLWTDSNDLVVLVDLRKPGVAITAKPTWDLTRRLFDVELDQVPLSEHHIVAEGESARVMIQRLAALRDFYLAADAIGGAQTMLEMTIEHLQTRVQFKRPLALFQALKHRCADMKASIVAAEAMLFDALRRLEGDLDNPQFGIKARGVKMFATTMFTQVAEDCLQLHGGIGMADEHPCHLFLKRALLSEQLSGSGAAYASNLALDLIENSGNLQSGKCA
ncbi:acyl-CoA dehydrogenase family protein [Ketobacter sp.]|uniref:acyl-CoA dehydrogenase family protein n=1 Tax=Ketobacter sp. TaxID=2083498 RepID=UPI000F1DCD5C|nr:acyl-CoA dehydrogenase [Ketobacter sp.]RLT98739.1 MAG: acyl-CoA dehydrogenase [Ketobacter sp.]